MMWPRLKLLHELLAEDGAIFVSIDDNEAHRLRDLMDEIFGEQNFIAQIIWQKKYSPQPDAKGLSELHEYIVVYAKHEEQWQPNLLPRSEIAIARYKNQDNDPRGVWKVGDLTTKTKAEGHSYQIVSPSGKKHYPTGRQWGPSETTFKKLLADNRIWFGLDGNNVPSLKQFLTEVQAGTVPTTLWLRTLVGDNQEAVRQLTDMDIVFDSPKPIGLIEHILKVCPKPDAIVLDSFAGSGTTAHAVIALNKKDGGNRKFILVEMEDYADKLTAERVRRVIKGYKFEGTQREELMRVPITLTALKNANELLEKANSFDLLDKYRFDRIAKSVEDGALVVTGEKKITEKVEGLGGSFTFCTLGEEMSMDRLLAGDKLPSFDALAKYVFYTATGRTLADVPKQKADGDGFIGETEFYRVHLYYKPEKKWLASNDAALTEQLVEKMLATNKEKKRLLVFAAAKFMSQKELTRLGVEFCQLPYAIHRILGD